MARAIIRYSLDDDASNKTGNQIREVLEDAGFGKIGTACYEGENLAVRTILTALDGLMRTLRESPGGGRLDHLWIYVDQADQENLASPS